MIDKNLLHLLGGNKKYIFIAVALMVVGLFANVGITACICWAINHAIRYDEYSGGVVIFLWPAIGATMGIIIRYICSRLVGNVKDTLGRKAKKNLREQMYSKIVKLGVRSTDGMSMAGLTQVSMEGVEQLDLYYSSYIPQFFYAMLCPSGIERPLRFFCPCRYHHQTKRTLHQLYGTQLPDRVTELQRSPVEKEKSGNDFCYIESAQ